MAARTETTAIAVGTTATPLLEGSGQRRTIIIHNASDETIYLGDEAVTVQIGMPVPPGEKVVLYWAEGDSTVAGGLYAIAASAQSAPNTTRVLTTYVL